MEKLNYLRAGSIHLINLTLAVLIITISLTYPASAQNDVVIPQIPKNANFYETVDSYNKFFDQLPADKKSGWKQFKRWEWLWQQRVEPNGDYPDMINIYRGIKNYMDKQNFNESMLAYDWTNIGPFSDPPMGGYKSSGLGRVNIVRINPANPQQIWAGTAGGGVWVSDDQCDTWRNLPFTSFLSLGVSDIAISANNENLVFVATGDADGSQSGMAPNSIGLIKSTDGGNTWKITGLSYYLNENKVLSKVIIHPDDDNTIFVSGWNGVYKTIDGGDTWEQVLNKSSLSDMEMHPENPDILYASTRTWGTNAIYATYDGGENWETVHTIGSTARIALSTTLSNPDAIFALAASRSRNFHSIWKSEDTGENWDAIGTYQDTPNILGYNNGGDSRGQGEYDLAFAVAPWSDREIWVGGINIWYTQNGGNNWELKTHWYGGYDKEYVHADQHDIVMDPETGTIYAAHDGGIDYSVNSGRTWIEGSDNMDITQLYHISVSQQTSQMVIGGAQDNGTSLLKNGDWNKVMASDGMKCLIDPLNDNNMYASIYYGGISKSSNGGKSFSPMINDDKTGESGAWVTPYMIAPSSPNILWAGFQNMWKSTNYGNNWTKMTEYTNRQFLEVAIAPSNPDYVYGSSGGALIRTTDGGNSWEDMGSLTNYITGITVDPNNPNRLWVTNGGYNQSSKVYYYDGNDWTNLTGNLPNIAVYSIIYQKNSPDRIYIGTDIGVFMSDYNSGSWELFGNGLPNLMIPDLAIMEKDSKLYAGTYGRGTWVTDLNTCNLPTPVVNIIGNPTVCPGDSVFLESAADFPSYEWSNGETTKRIIVKEGGLYSLTIDDGQGCKASSEGIRVTILPDRDTQIKTLGDYPVCEGYTDIEFDLSAPIGFETYEWSTGDADRRITVTELGDYWFRAWSAEGCEFKSDTLTVKVEQNPDKPTITRLSGTELTCDQLAPDYQWYKDGEKMSGEDEKRLEIDETGNYSVDIFNEAGCSTMSDPFNVISSVEEINFENANIRINKFVSDAEFILTGRGWENSVLTINISDLRGISILSKQISSSDFNETINLNANASGTYFINISNGIENWNFKVVKVD